MFCSMDDSVMFSYDLVFVHVLDFRVVSGVIQCIIIRARTVFNSVSMVLAAGLCVLWRILSICEGISFESSDNDYSEALTLAPIITCVNQALQMDVSMLSNKVSLLRLQNCHFTSKRPLFLHEIISHSNTLHSWL